jgi:hypothetical protein
VRCYVLTCYIKLELARLFRRKKLIITTTNRSKNFSNNSRRSVSNCLECFDKISQIFSYFWKFSLVMDGMAMSAKKINVIRRYTTNLFNFHENANFDLHKTFT